MKKILFGLLVSLMLLVTTGCGVTIGDTASSTNTDSNNDNSVDNSVDNSSNGASSGEAGGLLANIANSILECSQNLNGTNIQSGSYNMQKLEYGSVVSVQNQLTASGQVIVNFTLAATDLNKSISCGSEYRLVDGTTKTHLSTQITYK